MALNETEDGKVIREERALKAVESAIYDCAICQIPITDILFRVHKIYREEMTEHLQIEPKAPKYLRKEEF